MTQLRYFRLGFLGVVMSDASQKLFQKAVRDCGFKFAEAERKHKWQDKFLTATEDEVQEDFKRHVAKGDPRDVAIYCFIMIFRGWSIKP